MCYGIVVSDPSDWTAQRLRSAFIRHKLEADFLNLGELCTHIGEGLRFESQGIELTELDGILVRDMGRGKPHDVAFRFETLSALEMLSVRVVNPPQAIAKAANKYAASLALHRAGIPTPRTVVATSMRQSLTALSRFGMSVSKPLFGFKGRGMALLAEDDEATLKSILESSGMVYLQEFISLENPRDIRAFVAGDEVIGAIYRVAPPGSWISNLAKGGKAEMCPTTDELCDLAVKASRAVGALYSGVDLLETSDGLEVIEVNGTPSAKGIFDALGIDATEAIVRTILG